MSPKMLVNLSFLISEPTGLATYARNLFPQLTSLDPMLLIAEEIPKYHCYLVPSNMTPQKGSRGHLNRLLWTQFQLQNIYRETRSQLLFSPIPEAPLRHPISP